MSSDSKKVPLIQRMLSSGGSALITKTLVTPFDVVKTYIQVRWYEFDLIQAEFTIRERKQLIDVLDSCLN